MVVAGRFHKLPHEVREMSVADFNQAIAFIQIEQKQAGTQ